MKGQAIYLDYAAATPIDPGVVEAMRLYFSDKFYNPSATYNAARQVHKDLEAGRAFVAHWLGSKTSEVFFTAGGSEANNLAIHGVMRQFPEANVVVSGIEHESVLEAVKRYDYRIVSVKPDGTIDLLDLEKKIDENTVLVSVMYANNEIGTIQPLKDVSEIISKQRTSRYSQILNPTSPILPLFFHSDACQAANYLDLSVARLGVDLFTINGGKVYGPKQSGALYVKGGIKLLPIVDGGSQERGLRSGTENVAGSIGFGVALNIAQNMRREEAGRLKTIQQEFIKLLGEQLPEAVINGSLKRRLPNNVHVTLPGKDNERLLIQLDEAGVQAAAGSACSASSDEPSHVLKAIGLTDQTAQSSIRFTLGRGTTMEMIKHTVELLKDLVKTSP